MTNLFLKFSPILLFTISGRSMYPTYKHGDTVIVFTVTKIKKYDVIVFRNLQNHLLGIKRVVEINKDALFLVGDNARESTDSRKFGWIKKKYIVGKVIGKI